MAEKYLEAGKVINTHGLGGEVKIQPWADSPDFLTAFKRYYIDSAPVGVLSARVHKGCVIALLEGVGDINGAIKLKNKTVYIDRDDARLEKGRFFVADLIGLSVTNSQTGEDLGVIRDVLTLPSNDVYIVSGVREMLVPAVPEFVIETNIGEGFVKVRVIDGM